MTPADLYRDLARARAFELAIAALWQEGLISGEMHLGTGEEAIAAGIVACLRDGDALALDHRPTPWTLLRGVDPIATVRELLGRPDGLCRGQGGHMHLFDRSSLVASSGIVGAAGPTAVGLALAARRLRPDSVAVATFGDGALNEGMLMESLNLAVVWKLPVLFVCKDNDWAITTRSSQMTGGSIADRARGFGLPYQQVDGLDMVAVQSVAQDVLGRMRGGGGPAFLHATCARLDGHMLGLVETTKSVDTIKKTVGSALKPGGGVVQRMRSLTKMMGVISDAVFEGRDGRHDPVPRNRKGLPPEVAQRIDDEAQAEFEAIVTQAMEEA